jgi:hypothetical protein
MATKDFGIDPTDGAEFAIVNGPSHHAFFDALKYAYGKTEMTVKMTVRLSSTEKRTIELRVISISHDDNSGHSLSFRAYVISSPVLTKPINGYYDPNSRTGSVAVTRR